MRIHNLLHQTKPYAAPLDLRSDRFMSAVKRLEDVSNINEANPQTTIFNGPAAVLVDLYEIPTSLIR